MGDAVYWPQGPSEMEIMPQLILQLCSCFFFVANSQYILWHSKTFLHIVFSYLSLKFRRILIRNFECCTSELVFVLHIQSSYAFQAVNYSDMLLP
jgi:hypothetical protein